MNNPQNKNSNLPLAIIGLVLIAAIGGGWWLYSRSKAQPVKSNANSGTSASPKQTPDPEVVRRAFEQISLKAPGAQPANMLGTSAATVTVEEFADFQCGTCAAFHPKMKELNSLYSGRIKFIYRNFPLTQIHKNAYQAAIASEAAGAQGKFWAMQDQLFANQQAWANASDAPKKFEEYAQKIGLDAAKFQMDVAGLPAKNRVDADLQRGLALGVGGTPTVYINGAQLAFEQMEVNQMRQIIEAELRKSSSQPQTSQTAPATATANQSANGANASKSASNAANVDKK